MLFWFHVSLGIKGKGYLYSSSEDDRLIGVLVVVPVFRLEIHIRESKRQKEKSPEAD